jgi:serine/threonine protein phosphatase 1
LVYYRHKFCIVDLQKYCIGKKVAIIGDIHGCYDELSEMLDAIDWSPQSHILILTGGHIDRGPKIKETLMFVMNTPSVH